MTALSRVVLRELTPLEVEFQRRVTTLATQRGWLWFHAHSSKHSPKGFPDLCMVDPLTGRTLYAELKVGDAPVRPEQLAWLDALARNPHNEVFLWRWVWPGDVLQEIATVLAR